jgi:hypothetical protein
MKKEEILEQAISECVEIADQPQTRAGYEKSFREIFSSALDRYAFSVVQESVPAELIAASEAPRSAVQIQIGFNSCRSQTVAKAKQLTNQ